MEHSLGRFLPLIQLNRLRFDPAPCRLIRLVAVKEVEDGPQFVKNDGRCNHQRTQKTGSALEGERNLSTFADVMLAH